MGHTSIMPMYKIDARKCIICHSAEALDVLFLSLCASNCKKKEIHSIINSGTPTKEPHVTTGVWHLQLPV